MRQKKLEKHCWLLTLLVLFCLLVYSCLQDDWGADTLSKDRVILGSNKELTSSEAERWYNATNPSMATVRALSSTNEIQTKPKWSAAIESRRGNFEVVETPLMMKGAAMLLDAETKMKIDLEKNPERIRNLARMVVIKNLKTGEVCNFIMIFVGTYDYLMTSKTLLKNSYLHREPDFEGSVYYYNSEQGLVNGWRYKAGKVIAAISPSIESDYNIATRAGRPGVPCSFEVGWVDEWDCWNEPYQDREFGTWMSAVCKKNSHPMIFEVCVEEEESRPGPWEEKGGGGGGGYNPPSPPNHEKDQKDPCSKAQALSADVGFKSRVWDLFSQMKVGGTENGWILSTTGEVIRPSIQTATNMSYSSEQIAGKSFAEWYHSHPTGGGMTSYADLKALAIRYQRGHITDQGFTYGVISVFGCLSMMIVSPADFSKFAESIVNESLKEGFSDQVELPNTERGSFEKHMGNFLDFLQANNSGLQVMFRPMSESNVGNWKPQELDADKKMKDVDCN